MFLQLEGLKVRISRAPSCLNLTGLVLTPSLESCVSPAALCNFLERHFNFCFTHSLRKIASSTCVFYKNIEIFLDSAAGEVSSRSQCFPKQESHFRPLFIYRIDIIQICILFLMC